MARTRRYLCRSLALLAMMIPVLTASVFSIFERAQAQGNSSRKVAPAERDARDFRGKRHSVSKDASTIAPRSNHPTPWHTTVSDSSDFEVVVLSMNRAETLKLLLQTLEATDFCGDSIKLSIRFDYHQDQADAIHVAESYKFSHGSKIIYRATSQLGLAQAWFNAWEPKTANSRAIILEDDILLSPDWYSWLKLVWIRYDNLENIAGVSLMRQVLVPKQPHEQREIVNEHNPFLYSLIGSIAFSPSAAVWLQFRDWVHSIDLDTYDVSTPGLITSEWWNALDKKNMWTQHFIYFTLMQDLYTLYVNLPSRRTLAAHLRAKGAHYDGDQGADFELGAIHSRSLPRTLKQYGWDGKLVSSKHVIHPDNGVDLLFNVMMKRLRATVSTNNMFYFMMIDNPRVQLNRTTSHSLEPDIFSKVSIISPNFSVTRDILNLHPNLAVFTQNVANTTLPFGVIHQLICPQDESVTQSTVNFLTLVQTCRVDRMI